MTQAKPLPQPTPETQRFWDSCKSHAMELPRCRACGKFHYYPRALCPHCWSTDLEWVPASGRGTVYSFVINHRPAPGFQEEAPYVIAVVETEEGVRIMTNLVGVDPDPAKIAVNMPVQVEYDDVSEQITLPKFRPA